MTFDKLFKTISGPSIFHGIVEKMSPKMLVLPIIVFNEPQIKQSIKVCQLERLLFLLITIIKVHAHKPAFHQILQRIRNGTIVRQFRHRYNLIS